MEYQAVGLDLDGTLLDHRAAPADAVDAFVTALRAPPSEHTRELWVAAEDQQFERWRAGRITFQEQRRCRLRSFLPAIQVEVPQEETGLDVLFAQYLVHYRAAWRPFPDAVKLLEALHSQRVAIGVLTNGNHEQQLDKLAVMGLDRYIDLVCTSERIGFAKPDPRAFHALANGLRVEPAELVFLGDNPEHDIAGARAAGLRAGLVQRSASRQVNLFEALATAQ